MDEQEDLGFKYIQTTLSTAQHEELVTFYKDNDIKNQRAWLREVIMKEVRKDDESEPLLLH